MIPVTDTFRMMLRQPHRRTVRVTALPDGKDIPVNEGTVQFGLGAAGNAVNVRSGDVTVPGYQWVPADEAAALAPFGQRLRIEVGVDVYGSVEWCDLGEFLIVSAEVVRPAGVVRVSLIDRAYQVHQYVLEDPRTFSNRDGAADQALDLVRDALGHGVGLGRDDSNGAHSRLEELTAAAGTSRWEMCRRLAESVDCSIGFDRDGRVELVALEPSGGPVETLDVGERGVVGTITSAVGREGVVNKVVVYHADQQDPPNEVRAESTQTTGPLKWGGPMGRLTKVVTRGGLLSVTHAGAKAEADRELAAGLSRVREMTMTTSPMPHLEAGDVVSVVFPNGESELARIQAVTHGLQPDSGTTITARWVGGNIIGPMQARAGDFLAGER